MSQRALVELLRGRGAHADAVECFRGLPVELAGRAVAGFQSTVWQQLGHIDYWMRYELARIGGAAPAYPEQASLSWPRESAPGSAEEWAAEIRAFEALLGKLSRLAESGDAELSRSIPNTHSSHQGVDTSILGILWQTVVHNSYHLGQVVQLRRALGAWPPPSGGDTW
jgi:uncharacterized damage-inducible protein DinB